MADVAITIIAGSHSHYHESVIFGIHIFKVTASLVN